MHSANATYRYGEGETIVSVSLEKHHIRILLGEQRQVLWYYDQIMKLEEKVFSYPGPLTQTLEFHTHSFAEALTLRMKQQQTAVHRHRGSTLLKLLLGLLILAALFYFLALPRLAASMADRVSIEYEQELGEKMYQSMKGSFEIDARRTAYINSFFEQLHLSTPYRIQVTVIKSDIANAYAMPGGHIVVHDRILAGMTSYEELAALLSHEFTHVHKRHSLRSLFRQLSSQLFFTLLLGDIDVAGGILLRNADGLKQLSYSRSLEMEADAYGAQLLTRQRISCQGFIGLFRLLKVESGNAETYEWLNSHPDLDNRINNIRNLDACQSAQPATNASLQTLFRELKL